MEIGANRRSLTLLGLLLAVLAFVLYFQSSGDELATAPPARNSGRSAPSPPIDARPAEVARTTAARPTGGRFRPRLGGERGENRPDPLTADSTLRTDLLHRVQGIEEPAVERDIFNFGRPKRAAPRAPTPSEAQRAQARLDALAKRRPTPTPRSAVRPATRPAARPPDWKYFGQANDPGSQARRAFLLDGEDIIVAAEGRLLQGRYRLTTIHPEEIVLKDTQAGVEFTLPIAVTQ